MNGRENKLHKTDLLTAKEEARLSQLVQEGLRAAEKIEPLEKEGCDDSELEAAVIAGKKAKAKFIERNMGLVRFVANRYRNSGLDFEDLVQEGVFGLARAIEKCDPDMGNRFSTYGIWWIRRAIGRAVENQSRTIRVPGHISQTLGIIAKRRAELEQEYGCEVGDAVLEADLDLPEGRIAELKWMSMTPRSIDAPIKCRGEEGKKRPLSEVVSGTDSEATAAISACPDGHDLYEAIGLLTDRERDVVSLRYGIDGTEPKSLDEVAGELGLAAERAQQIELKALARLRSSIGRSRSQACA
ncbi:MAG: sigma-70 family RNA polymerase sigma factor [Eggerthellaceae bacterium]|nr:sigma-70 family RNA polymerase sigma factor [Eggerthellaceae bacterium]